jgi:hypothetical protein
MARFASGLDPGWAVVCNAEIETDIVRAKDTIWVHMVPPNPYEPPDVLCPCTDPKGGQMKFHIHKGKKKPKGTLVPTRQWRPSGCSRTYIIGQCLSCLRVYWADEDVGEY